MQFVESYCIVKLMNIPLVDAQDKIISSKDRANIDYANDIFRTASLWITNSNGDVLLAQRKFDKKKSTAANGPKPSAAPLRATTATKKQWCAKPKKSSASQI